MRDKTTRSQLRITNSSMQLLEKCRSLAPRCKHEYKQLKSLKNSNISSPLCGHVLGFKQASNIKCVGCSELINYTIKKLISLSSTLVYCRISKLGSGSDFEAYFIRLGIAAGRARYTKNKVRQTAL